MIASLKTWRVYFVPLAVLLLVNDHDPLLENFSQGYIIFKKVDRILIFCNAMSLEESFHLIVGFF
jgi:hypothetical protein